MAAQSLPFVIHAVRNSLIDSERVFTLEPDCLAWTEKGDRHVISYRDIKSVNLISYAGGGAVIKQATLKTHGGKKLKIRSHSYKSLANFEDRNTSFARLMRGLMSKVAEQSPDARFSRGNTALWLIWLVVGLLIIVLVSLAIAQFDFPGGPAVPTLVIAAIGGTFAWRELKKGRMRFFDPVDPPENLLDD